MWCATCGAESRHHALVRAEVRRHGGEEVKSAGDGFMLAFSSAQRAVACAVAIQRAVESSAGRDLELKGFGEIQRLYAVVW